MHGLTLSSLWCMHGLTLSSLWCMHGLTLSSLWCMHGLTLSCYGRIRLTGGAYSSHRGIAKEISSFGNKTDIVLKRRSIKIYFSYVIMASHSAILHSLSHGAAWRPIRHATREGPPIQFKDRILVLPSLVTCFGKSIARMHALVWTRACTD